MDSHCLIKNEENAMIFNGERFRILLLPLVEMNGSLACQEVIEDGGMKSLQLFGWEKESIIHRSAERSTRCNRMENGRMKPGISDKLVKKVDGY